MSNERAASSLRGSFEPFWHSRGYLPHFESPGVIQFVTFRLADSLPTEVLARLEEELRGCPPGRVGSQRRLIIEAHLDVGHGSCLLCLPEIAELVQSSLLTHDGERYRLLAWTIMPSHVHLLLEPLGGWALSKIMSTWKHYTGHRIRHFLALEENCREGSRRSRGTGLTNAIWQREYWDRFIRDEGHYAEVLEYIRGNPVKAGIVAKPEDWPWSSAGFQR